MTARARSPCKSDRSRQQDSIVFPINRADTNRESASGSVANPRLLLVDVLDLRLALRLAEVMGKLVPSKSLPLITGRGADAHLIEKDRIEGYPHAEGRTPVSRLNRTLVKETCRGDVSGSHKIIAPLHKACDFGSIEMLGRRRDIFRRGRPRLQRLPRHRGRSS